MKATLQSAIRTDIAPAIAPRSLQCATASLLQRKCACGSNRGSGYGECGECRRKKLLGAQPALLQPKLILSQPGDRYEQEADRVADQVMRAPGADIQRRVDPNDEAESIQTKPASGTAPAVTPDVQTGIQELWGSGGRPLPPATRAFMESRFGYDFSRVRIHTGDRAASLTGSVSARAFTVGHSIVFAAGEFSPQTVAGRSLIAHELVHTIQQSGRPLGLQRACKGLDAQFRQKQQTPDPMSNPCRSRNARDCCDNLLGCDRADEATSALKRANGRLESAVAKLEKVIIGRRLRIALRRLFGKRRFKKDIVGKLRDALEWLGGAVVPSHADKRPVGARPAKGPAEKKSRAVEPNEPELPPGLEEAPLEDSPSPAPPKPAKPTLPPRTTPGSTGSPGLPGQIALTTPTKPCPESAKAIFCSLPCGGSRCESGDLAQTAGGMIELCPLSFEDPLTLEATLIHEAMHNVFSGERDIYAYSRLFRVLAHVRDPAGILRSIALQNPDSYTALVMAASGTKFDEFIKAEGGGPPLGFEGFGLHRRQKAAPEVALGFASAGIKEAAKQVHGLVQELSVVTNWSSLSDDLQQTGQMLRQHGLLASKTKGDVAADLERLKPIRDDLDEVKKAVNSVRTIQREDSFEPASYGRSVLTVTKRFFALNSQRSQTQEVIRALVESSKVKSGQVSAYARFLENAIGQAKGLSGLPFPGPAAQQPTGPSQHQDGEPAGVQDEASLDSEADFSDAGDGEE